MMCTYLDKQEKQKYSTVTDAEVNDLLQKIRKQTNKLYIKEYSTIIKRWFAHPIIKKSYEVYWDRFENEYPEVQIMNFYPEHDHVSSLNSVVPKHTVINYLYGLLAGLNSK